MLWGRHPIGVRRLLALIAGLPPGSATHRSLDPNGAGWNANEELLALMAELLDEGNRLFIQANAKEGTQKLRPLRIPRPYEKRVVKRRAESPQEVIAELARQGVYIVNNAEES